MGILLNIETTTSVCAVSFAHDGNTVSHRINNEGQRHSDKLTVFIEDIVRESNLSMTEIDAVAISKGPGSYTGLRIGMSVAKGICYALNKPLIGVDTLESLAVASLKKMKQTDAVYMAMIDARRMDAYVAIYSSNGSLLEETKALTLTVEFLKQKLNQYGQIILSGDAAGKCKALLPEETTLKESAIFCDAIHMQSLSEYAFKEKQFEDVAYIEPFYLKKPNITISNKKLI